MHKNILFDFDGTISDTSDGIINAAQYALNRFNIDCSEIDLNNFIGPPLQDAFKNFCGIKEEQILDAIQIFREYYQEQGLYESKIYPEIDDIIKKLYDSECELFIASTKPTAFIEILLDKYKLKQYFTYVCGSPLHGECTAKDIIISNVIERFKLDLNKTIMVGDRKHDIIGAKKNMIASIGVEYGIGTIEELKKYSPEYIAKTPKDILRFIL